MVRESIGKHADCSDNRAENLKTLVTGANGFVGTALCKQLQLSEIEVHAATRSATLIPELESLKRFVVGELDHKTDWMHALTGVEAVVHLAARVHVMNDEAIDPLREFLKVNVEATVNLARQAAAVGVKRFVYLSSIKVNGESTTTEKPFRETDAPNPQDSYAVSKLRAEQALQAIAVETGMEIVIVRSPLIYGPGVKANFARLLKTVDKGIPLPLGCVTNKRSLVFVGNLCDALMQCVKHPGAAGHTYLVSDGTDMSSAELVQGIAAALNRPARLVSVPVSLMRAAAQLIGKATIVDRLTQPLVMDSSSIRKELGWMPPYTVDHGLRITMDWYQSSMSGGQS